MTAPHQTNADRDRPTPGSISLRQTLHLQILHRDFIPE
jgi:hypothetical protein